MLGLSDLLTNTDQMLQEVALCKSKFTKRVSLANIYGVECLIELLGQLFQSTTVYLK